MAVNRPCTEMAYSAGAQANIGSEQTSKSGDIVTKGYVHLTV